MSFGANELNPKLIPSRGLVIIRTEDSDKGKRMTDGIIAAVNDGDVDNFAVGDRVLYWAHHSSSIPGSDDKLVLVYITDVVLKRAGP